MKNLIPIAVIFYTVVLLFSWSNSTYQEEIIEKVESNIQSEEKIEDLKVDKTLFIKPSKFILFYKHEDLDYNTTAYSMSEQKEYTFITTVRNGEIISYKKIEMK